MLHTFYNNFGFMGSFLLAFVLFIFFIFWIAGLAGICHSEEKDQFKKNLKIVIAVLIPPFPFFWLIWDMYAQRKLMKQL